jgi:hypothetical protein
MDFFRPVTKELQIAMMTINFLGFSSADILSF